MLFRSQSAATALPPAKLTLTKVVVNDNGGSAVAADWTLTANGLPFAAGVEAPIDAGTYALAESGGPTGYTAGVWTCAGGVLVGGALTVTNGQTATCSITNDDQPAPTTTVVTSAPDPSLYGSLVTLIATVTGSRGPSGTVQFLVDGVPVGTPVGVVDGQAAASISTLSVGSHTIAAQYSGDQNNAPSAGTTPHATIPRPLTVAADNVTAILGSPLPAFTVAVSGGVVAGDDLGALSCTTAAPMTAARLSAVGGYPIICSGYTNPNYTYTYLDGLLSVVYRIRVIEPTSGGTFPTKSFVPIRFLLTDVAGNQIPDGEADALVIPQRTCQVEIVATGAQTEGPDCAKYDSRSREFSDKWKLRPHGTGAAQIDITVQYLGTPVITSQSVAIQIVP